MAAKPRATAGRLIGYARVTAKEQGTGPQPAGADAALMRDRARRDPGRGPARSSRPIRRYLVLSAIESSNGRYRRTDQSRPTHGSQPG
jgi:hypothetical protein